MYYYKMPINTDLSITSYRVIKIKDNYQYIEYSSGYKDEKWIQISEEELLQEFNGLNPFLEEENKENNKPYQPSNAEIAQMISDLQADLIIAGVL